ncbi:hypothetical protein [Phenylobacterium sp.]|uniref:hypothetical protein n=1 Tax=Phenylobacterium sp. TaxID=1871053 RepID=UPI0025DCBF3C|nr:hypothetical protein [Phenylobacterium sp.]
MATLGTAVLLVAVATAVSPARSVSRPERREAAAVQATATPAHTTFKCQDGGNLTAQFATRDARFVAIVDAGDGPHALPVEAWTGGPAKLTWTDGRRTLTWSPGVQIMWMDGVSHRMCGRGEHQH